MKKIPISIHPLFFVLAALIGWLNSSSFIGTLLWMAVIFISVLFHELGHALTALFFGQNPRISLIAFGGATSYEVKNLKFWKQFLIVLNGPLFGILLFLFATALLNLNFKNIYLLSFFKITQIVNLFWTVINLLPVLPLDGGQLLRILLEGFFGIKGFKLSVLLGMLIAFGLSIFFFIRGGFLIGAIFFLFAFQSFDMFRKTKYLSDVDRNQEKANSLKEGEKALAEGRKNDAIEIFKELRDSTKKGVIYTTATHYLAFLSYEQGEKHLAYELLLEIKDQLPDEAKCLLHDLAYLEKNWDVVCEYSALCYQLKPSLDVALKNARSFAYLNKAKYAGGWLQTSAQYEDFNLEKILEEKEFENIKTNNEFQKFIAEIEKDSYN